VGSRVKPKTLQLGHLYLLFACSACNIKKWKQRLVVLRIKIMCLIGMSSERLLFNTNSAIFQLYHGKNKLHFNEMMVSANHLKLIHRVG
jgi:hypothetical protein